MVYFKILIPNFTGLSQYFFAMEVSSKPIYKVELFGNKKIIIIKGEKKVQPVYLHCLILHCVESSDFWDQVLGIADDPHKCSISNTATAIDYERKHAARNHFPSNLCKGSLEQKCE